jgi:hypothetical protein
MYLTFPGIQGRYSTLQDAPANAKLDLITSLRLIDEVGFAASEFCVIALEV